MLALFAPGGGTLIAVLAFLLVIGGVFTALDRCGMMAYMLDHVAARFGAVRYHLVAVCMLFFMAMGAMIGSFEECVLIVPMAQVFGVSAQLCVLAFAFGDGFSNVLYPTHPALLIGLSLAGVSYGTWFRFSLPFQLMNLLLTCPLLLLGYAVGY